LLTVVPEPTSIENAYRFIKSALYRRFRNASANDDVRAIIEAALDQKNPRGIRTPLDLVAAVAREHPAEGALLKVEMAAFRPRFVVNQVREEADAAIGHQLVAACARHLGVRSTYAGFVRYDEAVWRSVRQRRMFMVDAPGSPAAEDVSRLARSLARGETMTLPW